MQKNEYNGWYNIETWQANLWYDSIFEDIANETYDQNQSESFDELVERIAGAYESAIEEISGITELPDGFVKDVALNAWQQINWDELANHHLGSLYETAER